MCEKVQAPNEDSVYSAISQHWVHSEQTRWTLLSNFLTANSILLLAWATIFADAPTPPVLGSHICPRCVCKRRFTSQLRLDWHSPPIVQVRGEVR
jgi:hypothetical protein